MAVHYRYATCKSIKKGSDRTSKFLEITCNECKRNIIDFKGNMIHDDIRKQWKRNLEAHSPKTKSVFASPSQREMVLPSSCV